MRYALVLVLFVCCSNVFADEIWEPVVGISEPLIKDVTVDIYNKGVIYACSEKSLYRSEDSGETWRTVFTASGDSNGINSIDISEQGVFACTDNGVFKSSDGISNWKRIFKSIGAEKNSTRYIAFNNNKIFLGTRAGLFISSDNGTTWQKSSGETGSISIKWISFLEDATVLATEKGVYKGSGSSWKRTFITSTEETEYDADAIDEAATASKPVNSIFVKDKTIYLATSSGIFISKDKGESWQNFTSAGLGSEKINRIVFKDTLYAATDSGVFVFNDNDKIWQALYKGISTDKVNAIACDDKGVMWVATDKGLYRSNGVLDSFAMLTRSNNNEENVLELFNNEPTIREVQKAAIEYAEVNPDKIKNWRMRAKIKAFFPELSVDYDKTINYDSGADRYYVGPHDWGASVSWDLGEIIWNKDQTSIDVRSKLMVQLRDDILDEITRVYFERRRLQIESQLSPPTNLRQKLEKDLRIQELTADLDALTGGYFSRCLK